MLDRQTGQRLKLYDTLGVDKSVDKQIQVWESAYEQEAEITEVFRDLISPCEYYTTRKKELAKLSFRKSKKKKKQEVQCFLRVINLDKRQFERYATLHCSILLH